MTGRVTKSCLWFVASLPLAACLPGELHGKPGSVPSDPLPGAASPGEPVPGDLTPGDPTPGDPAPGDPTPGDPTPGDPTPGDPAPGDPTPGDPAPDPAPAPDPLPTPPPQPVPSGVAYGGVTAAMWSEITAQRAKFGDPNDCQARVAAIPQAGASLAPCGGECINGALAASSTVVLSGGTYSISSAIELGGKQLIGAPGEDVVIDASGVNTAVKLGSNGLLANVRIVDAADYGVTLGSNSLAYRVSVGRTGYGSQSNVAGFGFSISGGSNNCIVSAEAYDGFNEDGAGCAACYDGGNADGFAIKFGSSHNSLIDAHAYRNSDDGFDFWEGKTVYVYFSSAFDGGKISGKPSKDGNGIKLGRGSALHYLYKTKAHDNKVNGFDINGNAIPSVLVQCDAHGNGGADFVGVSNQ